MLALALTAIFVVNAAQAATSGCGASTSWTFDDEGHSNQTLGNRSFLVHIPDGYSSKVAAPLVLSYHGYAANESVQELISGFSESDVIINGTGIVAVYPRGAYGPGQPGDGPTPAWQGSPVASPGVNDVAFTMDILETVQSNLCIDPNRIYASGKSEGGALTNLLACTNTTSAVISAYAPVSAALYEATLPFSGCEPALDTPLINFHGLSDTIVPYAGRSNLNGNTSYALPNITIWRAAVAGRNACNSSSALPDSADLSNVSTTQQLWNCTTATSATSNSNSNSNPPFSPSSGGGQNPNPSANPRSVVSGFSVHNLGHSWPNTLGLDGQKTDFNATNEFIVPFFEQHVLNFSFNYAAFGNASGNLPPTPSSGSGSKSGGGRMHVVESGFGLGAVAVAMGLVFIGF